MEENIPGNTKQPEKSSSGTAAVRSTIAFQHTYYRIWNTDLSEVFRSGKASQVLR